MNICIEKDANSLTITWTIDPQNLQEVEELEEIEAKTNHYEFTRVLDQFFNTERED